MPRFEWYGEQLELHPERALFWMDRATIIITDPHFGKGQSFRSAGIPIPTGSTMADLEKLAGLLRVYQPVRLLILGDFFHNRESRSAETIAALKGFREEFQDIETILIRGNHDLHAGDPPEELTITVVSEPFADGPFIFRHFPVENPEGYTFAGHLHPAVRMGNTPGGRLTAPCFLFGENQALLPAFGSFTGTTRVQPKPTDRVFLIGSDEVIEVPSSIFS